MKYYLGLDNGGTTTKAALFDMQGRQIAVAGMSTASITPKPGFVERDMEEMWQANCAVTREAIEKAGVDPRDIAGLGICEHGGRTVPRAPASSPPTIGPGPIRCAGPRTARRRRPSSAPASM